MAAAFLIQPQVFNAAIQRRSEWGALVICLLRVFETLRVPYYLLQMYEKRSQYKGRWNVRYLLSDAQFAPLVFSIIRITGQMLLCEADFPVTVVCDILQVRVYPSWNIDYQPLSYLSLIFHVAAQL